MERGWPIVDLFGAAGETHVIARVIRLGRNLVDAAGRRVLASIVPSCTQRRTWCSPATPALSKRNRKAGPP